MSRLYVRAFAVVACLLVVLAMPASVQNAAAKTKVYTDGPAFSSEWSDSKYTGDLADTNLNGTTKNARLQYRTSGRSLGDFRNYDSKDSDWTATSGSVSLADGYTKGEAAYGGVYNNMNRHPPGSAYGSDGNLYFLADSIYQFSPDGGDF